MRCRPQRQQKKWLKQQLPPPQKPLKLLKQQLLRNNHPQKQKNLLQIISLKRKTLHPHNHQRIENNFSWNRYFPGCTGNCLWLQGLYFYE